MHEGDAEAQYVARRHYLAYRCDEPGQSFDSMVGEWDLGDLLVELAARGFDGRMVDVDGDLWI